MLFAGSQVKCSYVLTLASLILHNFLLTLGFCEGNSFIIAEFILILCLLMSSVQLQTSVWVSTSYLCLSRCHFLSTSESCACSYHQNFNNKCFLFMTLQFGAIKIIHPTFPLNHKYSRHFLYYSEEAKNKSAFNVSKHDAVLNREHLFYFAALRELIHSCKPVN